MHFFLMTKLSTCLFSGYFLWACHDVFAKAVTTIVPFLPQYKKVSSIFKDSLNLNKNAYLEIDLVFISDFTSLHCSFLLLSSQQMQQHTIHLK